MKNIWCIFKIYKILVVLFVYMRKFVFLISLLYYDQKFYLKYVYGIELNKHIFA